MPGRKEAGRIRCAEAAARGGKIPARGLAAPSHAPPTLMTGSARSNRQKDRAHWPPRHRARAGRQPHWTWPALLASGVWPIRPFKCALTCHKSGRPQAKAQAAASTGIKPRPREWTPPSPESLRHGSLARERSCSIGSLALMDEISYRPRGATDTSEHRGGSVIAAHGHGDDQIVYEVGPCCSHDQHWGVVGDAGSRRAHPCSHVA